MFARTIIASTAGDSSVFLSSFSINRLDLLVFYYECRSLIGYITLLTIYLTNRFHVAMRL